VHVLLRFFTGFKTLIVVAAAICTIIATFIVMSHDSPDVTPTPTEEPTPTVISTPTPIPTETQPPEPIISPTPSPGDEPLPTLPPIPLDLMQVHFIDVGQGDAILIDLIETEVLIDGGGRSPGVVEYLSDYVDGALEVMVATHPHADHIGGLIEVLEQFDVNEIWHNGDDYDSKTYGDFMDSVEAEGATVFEARLGDSIEAGELSFAVLNPASLTDDTNNNSIVLSLRYGHIDFLFTGDAEEEAEAQILEQGVVPLPEVEVLKIGHHGSSSSSSLAFLDAIKPVLAIYMAAEGNTYGHPHTETLEKLATIGTQTHGTDTNGTIVVNCNGGGFDIHCGEDCVSSIIYHIPEPSPAPTVAPATEVCDCSSDVYNCSSFQTQAEAQACFEHCLAETGSDVHSLDSDGDASACESLH